MIIINKVGQHWAKYYQQDLKHECYTKRSKAQKHASYTEIQFG